MAEDVISDSGEERLKALQYMGCTDLWEVESVKVLVFYIFFSRIVRGRA